MFFTNPYSPESQINGYSNVYQPQGVMFCYVPVYYQVVPQFQTLNEASYYWMMTPQNPWSPNSQLPQCSNIIQIGSSTADNNDCVDLKEGITSQTPADKDFVEMLRTQPACDSYGWFEKKQNNQDTMHDTITLKITKQNALEERKSEDDFEQCQNLSQNLPFTSLQYEVSLVIDPIFI